VSLDAPLYGDGETSMSQQLPDHRDHEPTLDEGIDLAERLGEVLADLPARERVVLERRYGLLQREPETLGEIAKDLGVSAERVRQIQNAALARLKRPGALARLAHFA
jgi:RNA polymerase nonessential primary-like sigma factor